MNIIDRLKIEDRLINAIKSKQLQLYYQPQFDINEKKIVGFEALSRWSDEELGDVSPGIFIPIAEDHGEIIEIGTCSLLTACAQMKKWVDAGHSEKTMAVNLSPKQFKDNDVLNLVESALDSTGLPPDNLELEITESAFVKDFDSIKKVLIELRNIGVKIAMDDFGTGHSSLSKLKEIPLDKLKIDQSFVRDISCDQAKELVSIIAMIANKLGLKPLAEGVESNVELEAIRSFGINEVQGYLFYHPKSASDIDKLLKKVNSTIE